MGKPAGKLTIYDIARLCGVSRSAVSIVLNDRPGVSEETRARVWQVIREQHYIPNVNSRKLSFNKSFNLFVAVDTEYASFDDAFYNSTLMGIIEKCRQSGYNAVLVDLTTDSDGALLRRYVGQRNVDGVIFLESVRNELYTVCREVGLPFVVVDAHDHLTVLPTVYYDYRQTAEKAIGYLLEKGHREIAFLGMGDIPAFFERMRDGYTEALARAGLCSAPGRVFSVSATRESVFAALSGLNTENAPDAIFCAGDLIAIFAMQRLAQLGIRVPERTSVMAVDNIASSLLCTPMLTTVDVDKQRMGREAVELLLEQIFDPETPVISRRIPVGEIIERDSVQNRGNIG